MTREDQERDARLYFETLYPELLEGAVVAVGPFLKPHFMLRPAEALPYVVGKREVYVRITPLAGRPAKGRGKAEDSVTLPGVWVEIDVNGGPKTNGKLVADGAPSVEAAIDLARAVLVPTMLVRSGFGVHAYHLLDEPWVFTDANQRALAAELVAGWQQRLRHTAAEMGIGQLDSTADLARVLRPPGSFNGKGDEPVPVVLLDNAGPRYTVAQIAAEVLKTPEASKPHARAPRAGDSGNSAPADTGSDRTPEQLLQRYPKLSRIAHHDGNPPGDGSGHSWDFHLICEARRRVKPPISHDEAVALLAHARGLHPDPKGKGDRDDYLDTTVTNAFAEVESPIADTGPASDTPHDSGAWIGAQWRLPGDPIVEGWSKGTGDAAIVYLRRESGAVLRFPRLGELFEAATHVRRVSIIARAPCPTFSKDQAVKIAQQIVALCDARDEPELERQDLGEWLGRFREHLGAINPGDLLTAGQSRWDALVSVVDFKNADASPRDVAASTAGIRDPDGSLWLPASELMRHIRTVEREPIGWAELHSRMEDLGWEHRDVDQWEPDVDRTVARHLRRVFYIEPVRSDHG